MTTIGFALFETAIGHCAIAWSDRGITGVQLPESSPQATRARMWRRIGKAPEAPPPPAVQAAIAAIGAALAGRPRDLSDLELDLSATPAFDRQVFIAARAIAPGTTASYAEIAARIGDTSLARAVGQSLGRNPFAIVVPCHRVLAASGRIGGFSAGGGTLTKRRLLAIEGARVGAEPDLFTQPVNPRVGLPVE